MDDNLLRLLMMAGPSGPPPGGSWTARPGTSVTWRAVAWSPALGKFVAVGNSASVGNSTTGTSWTLATATLSSWNSVCWSPDLAIFVAVGSGGISNPSVMTSPDGINWTARSVPDSGSNWTDIVWAPSLGLFVATRAVTQATSLLKIATSPDGINWTLRAIPADPSGNDPALQSIAWSPTLNLFVAGTGTTVTTNKLWSSPDGITWTPRVTTMTSPAAFRQITDIMWSDTYNKFVASAFGTTASALGYSADGLSWTYPAGDQITPGQGWCVVDADGTFMMARLSGPSSALSSRVSYDGGANWTFLSIPLSQWQKLAYSPARKRVVAVSSNAPFIATSP